jgi:dihydropyrimidinase
MIDLALTNCRPVLPDGTSFSGSVLVDDGKIAGLLAGGVAAGQARETMNLGGSPVLPGIIDTHFHVGFHSAESDFQTETRSAAAGGVTTICRFFRNLFPYDESLPAEIALGERTSYVDFAFHVGILIDDHLTKLERWVHDYGVRSFKMYTCYKGDEGRSLGTRGQTDGFIFDVLKALARIGNVVQIVHCENEEIIHRVGPQVQGACAGLTDLEVWNRARPPIAEVEAIHRVGLLAEQAGAELFVPHVSSAEALDVIRERKRRGQKIYAETCPHYLALDTEAAVGILAKVNPPIRPKGNAASLWKGLRDGTVDVVGTDHATTMRAEKIPGDPWKSKPGFAGVGTLLPVLLSSGVHQQNLQLGDIARLQANAARVFRLPGKGRIEPGADADLTVVDLDKTKSVQAQDLQSASDFSIFERLSLKGWPAMTFQRGRLIARDGQVLGKPGDGRYIKR